MNRTVSRIARAAVAATLSAGLCLGLSTTANATIQYPISGGSHNEGAYTVTWSVGASRTYVSTYSLTSHQYCYAQQDYKFFDARSTVNGANCRVEAVGVGTLTAGDYAEYYRY